VKVRYENVVSSSDKLVKRLASAQEEMSKFRGEVAAFRSWLEKAYKILEDKEKQLASLNKVSLLFKCYIIVSNFNDNFLIPALICRLNLIVK
jgi:exonuclease VII large subunit